MTTRGMREEEMRKIADFIHEALTSGGGASHLQEIRARVQKFVQPFPLP